MQEVLYHPGWPKTATTSLQHGMVDYPNVAAHPWYRGTAGQLCHGILDQLCFGQVWQPGLLDALLDFALVDPERPVLLSDERIIGGPVSRHVLGHVGEVETMRRLQPPDGWRATVLITLRSPRGLIRSTYLQEVRFGSTRTYGQFLEAIRDERVDQIGPFAISRIVGDYVAAFGRDDVCVAFMEDFLADPAGFWAGVSVRLGLDGLAGASGVRTPSKNRTHLGPPRLERFLNGRILGSPYRSESHPIGRVLTRARWNHVDRRLGLTPDDRYFDDDDGREDLLVAALAEEITEVALAAGVAPGRVAEVVAGRTGR